VREINPFVFFDGPRTIRKATMTTSATRIARRTHHTMNGTGFAAGSVCRNRFGSHRTGFKSNAIDRLDSSILSEYPTPRSPARLDTVRYTMISTIQNVADSVRERDRRSHQTFSPMDLVDPILRPRWADRGPPISGDLYGLL